MDTEPAWENLILRRDNVDKQSNVSIARPSYSTIFWPLAQDEFL